MKKISLIFFVSLSILFLLSTTTYAVTLVPCGNGSPTTPNGTIDPAWRRCELSDVFVLILNVYNFLTLVIATPLAGILIVIGGVLLAVSGGSPNLASTAKRILWGAGIGIALILGAWLIINIVLTAIGYDTSGSWGSFPIGGGSGGGDW